MLKKIKNNYYVKSFFWGSLSKVIKAVVNFISVPILLKCYGESDYGILSLATAANAYIALLDLGINTGAIKYFSQWKAERNEEMIDSVARTNIAFYGLVGIVNSLILIIIGIFGKDLFSISDEQFKILRICLFIIASFSIFNWISTAFNQLLTAFGKIAFVQQILCITSILEIFAIILTVSFKLKIYQYFFITIFIHSIVLIPYTLYCRLNNYVTSIKPLFHWKDFKIVLLYSLNIFVLSLFQMTATNSRPIILGIFSSDAAKVSAEFRIISVVPSFLLMLSGVVSGMLLPKASETIALADNEKKEKIAYKGTFVTSILANILCIPFMICAKEFLDAYVGRSYEYLFIWLILWCVTILVQIHTTPCNSLILATGKTLRLVILTAVACVISIFINAFFAARMGVGSAVLGYFIYVVLVIGGYYLLFYKSILEISRKKVFISFLLPTFFSIVALFITIIIPFQNLPFWSSYIRNVSVLKCLIKTFTWFLIYLLPVFLIFKWYIYDGTK